MYPFQWIEGTPSLFNRCFTLCKGSGLWTNHKGKEDVVVDVYILYEIYEQYFNKNQIVTSVKRTLKIGNRTHCESSVRRRKENCREGYEFLTE